MIRILDDACDKVSSELRIDGSFRRLFQFLHHLQLASHQLGLFHLNVHGGGGVERSPIKKSLGERVEKKKLGVYMKKNHWGGGV